MSCDPGRRLWPWVVCVWTSSGHPRPLTTSSPGALICSCIRCRMQHLQRPSRHHVSSCGGGGTSISQCSQLCKVHPLYPKNKWKAKLEEENVLLFYETRHLYKTNLNQCSLQGCAWVLTLWRHCWPPTMTSSTSSVWRGGPAWRLTRRSSCWQWVRPTAKWPSPTSAKWLTRGASRARNIVSILVLGCRDLCIILFVFEWCMEMVITMYYYIFIICF